MEFIKYLVAASPIILPLIFLVVLQTSAKKGMFYSFVLVTIFSISIWGMDFNHLIASSFAGLIKALSIIWILFGAIFLLNILRKIGAIQTIIANFKNLTDDSRLHVIIFGFYFIALLEGASGFGAPAAIVAPLLVMMGIPPLAAASLSLIGNIVPMTYGAVGTPLIDGMGSSLLLGNEGLNIPVLIHNIAINASFIDLFIGSFIPVVQVILYTTLFSKEKSFKYTVELIPFSFLSGLIYTTLAYLSTVFLGAEFGALLGSLIGLTIIMFLIKVRFLLPKIKKQVTKQEGEMHIIKAWFPYVLVVLLLILSRVIKPIKYLLKDLSLSIHNLFNTEIYTKFDFFYSPGFILTFISIIVIILYKAKKEDVKWALGSTLISAKKTTFALVPALAMVYIFLNSQYNSNLYESMPTYLANTLSNVFGNKWIFMAPFIANLGTFISGSSTTSNIMFSQIQYDIALQNNIMVPKLLTAQALGANTGAVISVSKVVSAASVVGLSGSESKIMRITLGVSLVYALFIGVFVSLLL